MWAQGFVGGEMDRPLGPTLISFPTWTPRHTTETIVESLPGMNATDDTNAPNQPNTPALVAGTSTPQPVCGGPERMILLAVGADNFEGYYRGLADVIRVFRLDFQEPSITILAFPRDLWVSIPGLEEYNITAKRINTAYFYGNLYRLPGGGPTLLAQTLFDNFGLPSDHYLAMNMSVFVDVIDAVGGVDVDVPQGFPEYGIRPGMQHMTGEVALNYAHIRLPDHDWYRIDRQTLILKAFREKILEPEVIRALPEIAYSFLDKLLTDLSKADIASMICLITKVDRENISTYKIEPEMVTPMITNLGAWIAMPHEDEIRGLVVEFLDGNLP
ncbi:MAG: hypothetical protein FVQ83_12515 [Chloroflexi bacterium]|nr:hypothetical protein [Chloroflexota bacterium]